MEKNNQLYYLIHIILLFLTRKIFFFHFSSSNSRSANASSQSIKRETNAYAMSKPFKYDMTLSNYPYFYSFKCINTLFYHIHCCFSSNNTFNIGIFLLL
jgi:hypothetical protein